MPPRGRLFYCKGEDGVENILSSTAQVVTIITFCAAAVAWITKVVVINPLQSAITTLNDSVKELKSVLFRLDLDQKNIDKRLVAVESSNKSAHHRIDGLEVRLDNVSKN